MAATPRLESFKIKLKEAGLTQLVNGFDAIETRLAKVDWHIAHFATPKFRDKANNERVLSQVEVRFNGKLPPEIDHI